MNKNLVIYDKNMLEKFMRVEQKDVPRTNPRIPCVVSYSDSDHRSGYYSHRTLGLMPAGTSSTRSLGHYPIHSKQVVMGVCGCRNYALLA